MQIKARDQKVKDQQNVLVELDPEIARLFQASTSVSGKLPVTIHVIFLTLNVVLFYSVERKLSSSV